MQTVLKAWLPFVALATILAGTIFVVAWQSLRQSANDPQIQLAGDWADSINSGNEPSRVNLGAFIDPARSLAPFGIIYDRDGRIIASSASSPSTMLQPDGVFSALEASPNKEVRFTWQPASGERYATIIKKVAFQNQPYYVLAARNLREVDQRVERAFWFSLLGWGMAVVAVVVMQHTHLVARAVRRLGRKQQ